MHGMLHNAFGVLDDGGGEFDGVDLSGGDHDNSGGGEKNVNSGNREILNDDAETFYNLLKDAEQELYPGYRVETYWHVIVFTKPRDLYDMNEVANIKDLLMENELDNTTNLQQFMDNEDDVIDNVPGIMLNSPMNIIDVGAENNIDSDDEDGDEYDN
ncbi:hypothetical protein LWI29_034255 [Acer saccharum]|uniref:Uncharacterized protein n=1 Tax=Acer saccharum TaxID=4024 RepID=A0AA39SJR5_ACESA|nr:hypothetical protein LWI29_015117 [Acer saccharum]KAK0591000.1 hypothetical protein LWI29_034255 [Acer saccharum]